MFCPSLLKRPLILGEQNDIFYNFSDKFTKELSLGLQINRHGYDLPRTMHRHTLKQQ
jgi:hypothetical protein